MTPRIIVLVGTAAAMSLVCTLLLLVSPAEAATLGGEPTLQGGMSWIYGSAAAATCFSTLAAAFAVARVGTAAVAAITEKPELFGRMLVLVGLAEGIAIYGLIVSILILSKLG